MNQLFNVIFLFATFCYIFECQDTIPYQVSSNVYYIEETQAIIYKSFIQNKWRYSLIDQDGAITATYIIEGLQDLAQSYYFIEQNNQLYFCTKNSPNYQLIDLNLLKSGGVGYLTSGTFSNVNFACSQGGMIRRYGKYYFLICDAPLFYLQEVSLSAIQSTIQKQSYAVYVLSQAYLMFDKSLLVYKDNLFTNLSNVSNAGYILVDQKFDLFLQDLKLCKGVLDIGSKTFSCTKVIDLHALNEQDVLISKVFLSNGMYLIFGRDQIAKKFFLYDATTLDKVERIGSTITNLAVQLEFIQNGFIFYTGKNCQYTALYDPSSNQVNISQAFSNLPNNYMLVNPPFYNFNFQKGSTIFLSQGSDKFLYNINEIYKMCLDTEYIQLNSTCGPSCPVTSFTDNKTKKCYCDQNTIILDKTQCICSKNYYLVNANECKICTPYCQNCTSQTQCDSCQSGFTKKTDGTCKCIDGTYLSGSSKNQCLSCFDGYSLFSNTCQEQYLNYNSDIFTQSRINQAKDQIQASSEASLAGTTILSSIQNLISQTSFGILTNSLICQKLSFLILIDEPIPAQIYLPLTAMKDQFPTNQFKMLNYFQPLLSKDENQYQDARFEIVGLSFNILQTCGQSTIIFGICIFIFGTFYILIKYIKSNRVLSIIVLIYQKLFSGFLIQFFQLISTMFIIGVNQQLKQFFFDIKGSLPIGLRVNLVNIYLFVIIIIFYQQVKFLNKSNKSNNQYDFIQLNKEKILNGAAYGNKIKRNFMIIYLFFESFLIPTLYIQFSFSWKIASTVSIALQFIELFIIAFYMPFESKLSNGYFITNGFLWLGLYIQYFVLNIFCKKPDINNYSKTIDILSYSTLITIQVIILQQSAYIILALLVELYEYIKEKRLKKQNQFNINQSNNQYYSNFTEQNEFNSIKQNNKYLINQKLKLSYYEREMISYQQFNNLVASQTWVRLQPRHKETKNSFL
ncbi:hypothetical protein ABPG72_008514 [Tetrahymena utriculariae]